MSITGNLNTMELAELLQWLSQGQKTGTLVVVNAETAKQVYFQEGRFISAASSEPKKHLGHLLVSHGPITEDQLAATVARQEEEKKLLGAILVGMELITPEVLDTMLRLTAEEGIFGLFGWPRGTFASSTASSPPSRWCPCPSTCRASSWSRRGARTSCRASVSSSLRPTPSHRSPGEDHHPRRRPQGRLHPLPGQRPATTPPPSSRSGPWLPWRPCW